MLSSLEIQNFKGIKTGKMSDLAQVNVLVGRNNSGKSTILDALLLMRCAFARNDYLNRDGMEQIVTRRIERRNQSSFQSVSYDEMYHMMNTQSRISIRARFADDSMVSQEWDAVHQRTNLTYETSDGGGEHRDFDAGGSVENFRRSPWSNMAKQIGDDNAKYLALGHVLDPSTLRNPFLEKIWGRLFGDRRDRTVRDMVNEIYGLDIEVFNQADFGSYNRITAGLPERSVAVDWLGDGLRYALNILALGMLLEGTILMIEEVETHQHPESLKKLTQTLFELAKKQNLQLFLTTHSWELMTYALEASEEKGVGLAFHHVRLNDKGEFDARAIPQPDAKLLMDIGHDIRYQDKYIGAR